MNIAVTLFGKKIHVFGAKKIREFSRIACLGFTVEERLKFKKGKTKYN